MNKHILALTVLFAASFSILITLIPLVSAVEDTWTTMEPMPTARSGFGVAVVDGKIYAIGGYHSGYLNITEMYDPVTDTWITKQSMPTARHAFAIAVCQNKIYVIGGEGYVEGYPGIIGTTEVYDPSTDTWETKTSMPTSRANLCASAVNGKIYLMGGNTLPHPSFPTLSDKNEVYDPETDTWDTKAPIPNYIQIHLASITSSTVDDEIYVMAAESEVPFNRVYDPATDTWTSKTLMPKIGGGWASVATSGEFAPIRIHLLREDTHQIYNPETDTWTTGTSMPTPRLSLGIGVVNDEIYAIGGYDGETALSVNEKYTPYGYIPEFPSWITVPLFIMAAVAIIIYRKRLPK
jgi:N-acetylneuraminic acid mutarotase